MPVSFLSRNSPSYCEWRPISVSSRLTQFVAVASPKCQSLYWTRVKLNFLQ